MKYFIIAGEASGDLHASNLMAALKRQDEQADFCFLGGDLMQAQGGKMVRHYKEMAYMGFIPVILHARSILKNMKDCKQAIKDYQPDILILVDYPSFNLKMAEYTKKNVKKTSVFYYISPKLWAWKEYRLKSIKKYVDRVYSILPFEVDWYRERGYEVDYVGNPCVDAVRGYRQKYATRKDFLGNIGLEDKPIMALLAGSRMQEIDSSLPVMLETAAKYGDYQVVVAGAPSIEHSVYDRYLKGYNAKVVYGETYELLIHSELAIVTSGTATLETALMRVPQVVVYKMGGGKLVHKFFEKILNVKYISLVNLITNRRLVTELVVEEVTVERVTEEVEKLRNAEYRNNVLQGYDELIKTLGEEPVSKKAARMMLQNYRSKIVL